MSKSRHDQWSILYVADGELFKFEHCDTHDEAIAAAVNAQYDGEFDILDQHVYLLGPDHTMVELAAEDLLAKVAEAEAPEDIDDIRPSDRFMR